MGKGRAEGKRLAGLGIDAGSTTTKIVGVDADGALAWHQIEPTEPRMEAQADRLIDAANAEAARRSDLPLPLIATGYGRKLIRRADRAITEITCHARGVYRQLGHGGTLIDIGGQDSKVIVMGDDGHVINFSMNDKCAAGTGRFLEVVANRLQLSLAEFAEVAIEASAEIRISSTCTVFAESELVSLIARGEPVEQIVRGLQRSLIKRVAALARGTGIKPPLMLSGGVAHSRAVRAFLSEELGHEVQLPDEPQLMGAYGAALFARGDAEEGSQ